MLTPLEARQLDRLSLGATAIAPSSHASGARISKARGYGLEFQDYRRYQPGDDPRAIDWTIHARLQQLVVRVFRSDAHLRVHVLIDTSASMGSGSPDKLATARRIAAALIYIAVRQRDAIGLAAFDDAVRGYVAPSTGRPQLHRLFEMLRTLQAAGRSDATRALSDYGAAVHGPGLVVVLSDFFHPDGALEGLSVLLHRGLTPALVQIVSPDEIAPSIEAPAELVDVEDPDGAPLLVDGEAVAAYQARLAQLSGDLGEFCATHGLPWLRVEASAAFPQLLQSCVDAGLLTGQG